MQVNSFITPVGTYLNNKLLMQDLPALTRALSFRDGFDKGE